MALEPPWQLPVDVLINSILKINAKWPWSFLGSSQQISILNLY